ncbi:MAG: TetR/AcrR family transcriptional regulator [Ruthenibacterium sp.]
MAAPRNANIKQTILKSTAALLQTTSFEAITLAGIAKEAGISKGTLYYYYRNKDDILLDICEQEITALANAFTVWIENKEKDTRAPRLIRYVLQYGTGSALGNLRLYLIGAAVSGHTAVRERYIALYHSFEETLTAKLHERLPTADAEYLAWLLLTTMDGILVQKQLANPYFDADAFLEKTACLCCKV